MQRLHRRLDEVLGVDHAATLMTCLEPGGGRAVTSEAWGALHERLGEVLGEWHADAVFRSLWHLLLDADSERVDRDAAAEAGLSTRASSPGFPPVRRHPPVRSVQEVLDEDRSE
jgi:hypothetical protein